MEEAWRRTAMAAAVHSLAVCYRMAEEAADGPMDGARMKLLAAAAAARTHYLDLNVAGQDTGSEQAVAAAMPATARIGLAVDRMKRADNVHTACSSVFSLCAPHIWEAPRWHEWRHHRTAAVAHTSKALRRLHSAWSRGLAAMEILFMLQDREPLSLVWVAWGPAALQLLRLAQEELRKAQDAVRLMQRALILQFAAAQRLLLPAD